MGLLKKILTNESSQELDEVGKALRDRLIRLSSKNSSAYSALSLLKGYGSFRIGACLDLKDDIYKSYASVGLGVTKISIPLNGLSSTRQSFFKVPNPESFDFKFFTADMNFWMFALDNLEPGRYLLLAVEEKGSAFNPETIALLISKTNRVFFPPGSPAEPLPEGFDLEVPEEIITHVGDGAVQETESSTETSAVSKTAPAIAAEETEDGVRNRITVYHQSNMNFQGILLETTEVTPKNSTLPFAGRVLNMTKALGLIIVVLPSKRVLILLPPALDRELIAHRLSTSLGTEVLVCFEADNPEKALEQIRSYL